LVGSTDWSVSIPRVGGTAWTIVHEGSTSGAVDVFSVCVVCLSN
jgi:hypothetical protein